MASSSVSIGAFLLSADKMQALTGSDTFYFWTVTTPSVVAVKEVSRCWNRLSNWFRRKGFLILRVFELHPGGHGLHVHFITSQRIDINDLLPVIRRCGFGRTDVRKVGDSAAIRYLAKYLSKNRMDRPPCLRGMRLWGAIGFPPVKTKNVRVDSAAGNLYKELMFGYSFFHKFDPLSRSYLAAFDSCARFDAICELEASGAFVAYFHWLIENYPDKLERYCLRILPSEK
jgi:hypothetical protein